MQHAGDAACACPCKHHNREGENALVSLQHQKQTGNSKLGLSSCRESHRQKGGISQGGSSRFVSCGRRFEDPFPTQEPAFPRASTMTKNACCHSAQPTGRNHQCYNGNREEGRKEERKEGRKEERRRGVPTGIRTRVVRFYSYWITTNQLAHARFRVFRLHRLIPPLITLDYV